MKTSHAISWRGPHKHTLTGLAAGAALLLACLADRTLTKERVFTNQTVYMLLIPGIALLLRSWHPPIGILRTIILLLGGVIGGAVPMIMSEGSTPMQWMALAAGIVGAGMIGYGFTSKQMSY